MTVASYDSPVNSIEQLPTHASCPMGHQTLKALRGLLRTAHHFVPERLKVFTFIALLSAFNSQLLKKKLILFKSGFDLQIPDCISV